MHVHTLLKGGAGEKSGCLQIGDVLVDIEGTLVSTMEPHLLQSMSQGLEGTKVVAGFKRPPGMTHFTVSLVRSVPSDAFK